jgi:nucleotide-binding universal stress UspA family protein
VLPDAQSVFAAAGEGIAVPPPGLVDRIMAEASVAAEQTRALFDDVINRQGIAHGGLPQLVMRRPSASWRQVTGDAATLLARHGRFFDLIVLGRSDRVVHEPHSEAIEETLLRSGRPVLLAPTETPSGVGNVVAVAWNGAPQGIRALTAALPFLEKANAVLLITAGDRDVEDITHAVDYLAWHGVAARPQSIDSGSARHLGGILLDAAREGAADMLVMGAYSRAPWREQLFGGATRGALAQMKLPLLLMH